MHSNTSTSLAAQAILEAWNDLYVNEFLKDQIDGLADRETCWHQPGVKGLLTLLQANLSQPNTDLAQGQFNVSSSGNLFSIDLSTHKFEVNGLTESTYTTLSCVHLFSMAIAFFLVYPIILLLDSITVLCDLVSRPVAKQRIKRWETLLQSLLFTPLVIAGLVTGIFAMGSSEHFRTEHGIIGLATVVMAFATASVYFVELHFTARLRQSIRGIRWLQRLCRHGSLHY